MKYGHTVKKDGILYPAGAEVPEDTPKKPEDGTVEEKPKRVRKSKEA